MQLTFRQVLRHHAALLLSLALHTAQVRLPLHCLLGVCASHSAAFMITTAEQMHTGTAVREVSGSFAGLKPQLFVMPCLVHMMEGADEDLPGPRRAAS